MHRMKPRKRRFLTSRRTWLTQVLLTRLRSLDHASLTDAAMRYLVDETARKLAAPGGAYGELDLALNTARDLLKAVAILERPDLNKPVTATLLRRLAAEKRLPRVPPWL